MAMANDPALVIQILRRVIVGGLRVGECSGIELVSLDGHVECSILRDSVTRLGERDDGGDHVGLGWNLAHRNTVARSGNILLAVCQGLAFTKVDEIGGVATSCQSLRNIYPSCYMGGLTC